MSEVSIKLRARESVLRFKNGSPKLKEVLRNKCKERWKKNRDDFLDRIRNIHEDSEVQNTLTDIIKEDLRSIYSSDHGHSFAEDSHTENISEPTTAEDESTSNEVQWLMSQYDDIFENEDRLADMLDELNEVICPICQKNPLEARSQGASGFLITCCCGLTVHSFSDLFQIKENLMSRVDDHSNMCNCNPNFTVISENDENHVYLICYLCSSFLMLF